MKRHSKIIVALLATVLFVAIVGVVGFSQQKGKEEKPAAMQAKAPMYGTCDYISNKWWTVICDDMTPQQQGVMRLQDTGRKMASISDELQKCMENADAMKKNEYLTKNEMMKKAVDQLAENLKMANGSLHKAASNLEEISKKMEEMRGK